MIIHIKETVYRILRRLFRAFESRFSRFPELSERADELDEMQATVAAMEGANERVSIYVDRLAEELRAELQATVVAPHQEVQLLLAELMKGGADNPGAELEWRFADVKNQTDHQIDTRIAGVRDGLAEVRASIRFTQSMVQRQLDAQRVPTEDKSESLVPAQGRSDAGGRAVQQFVHDAPGFDHLYATFESRMRGDRVDIIERQREDYLERLSALPHPELPIVDLGCGRGELVGLLANAGQLALGVDSNASQIIESSGGELVEADLFEWLDAQEDSSTRAVVSLHVVEHLPLELQIRLIHESRRVLAPGGMLILETPNITSLAVGASTFWVDPTHERPVHPEFLRFLADDAGFAKVDTLLLHPGPHEFRGPDSVAGLVADLNGLLLGPSDVAVLATMPGVA